jgi:hypothetical protein
MEDVPIIKLGGNVAAQRRDVRANAPTVGYELARRLAIKFACDQRSEQSARRQSDFSSRSSWLVLDGVFDSKRAEPRCDSNLAQTDELLRDVTGARTGLVNLEALSDEDLLRLHREFERLGATRSVLDAPSGAKGLAPGRFVDLTRPYTGRPKLMRVCCRLRNSAK